ncbi:DUF3488 and transglutaminase-like domain-containing protein [Brachybacterium sp. AOP25-B2-12]|uniref:DUF3488 and transglutaminase-like domain-containing protein n=1 Tax=Brachybacterium sp. AOP25-B2-12 TaxID=3457710 RepID=UPI0040341D54
MTAPAGLDARPAEGSAPDPVAEPLAGPAPGDGSDVRSRRRGRRDRGPHPRGPLGPEIVRGLVLLVAIALASTPLTMLFTGLGWFVLLMGAALTVVGSGLVLRRLLRPTVLVPLGQGLALVLFLLLAQVQAGVLPPGGPVGIVMGQPGLLTEGIRELGGGRAPLELGGPGTVVVAVLLALVVLALDLLLMDLDQVTVTALVLACFVLSSALMTPGGGPWWTVAGPVAGAILVLGVRSIAQPPQAALVAGTLVLALVAGPALATVLPTRDPAPFPLTVDTVNRLTGNDANIGPVMIDDSVSVRRDLMQGRETEVLRLRTDAPVPGYLRLHTLNAYEDGRFESVPGAEPQESFTDRVQDPTRPEGLSTYEISVRDLSSRTLPAPPNIRWTDAGERLPVVGDRSVSGELPLEGRARDLTGFDYTVAAEEISFTEDELRSVDPESQVGPFRSGYIRADVPPIVSSLARQVRTEAGAENAFDTAQAYVNYFHTTFDYDLDARSEPGEDPVTSFLEDRTGYCEQFAATFALMMDSQGFPTRVVIGFTAGTVDGDERTVTNRNAHAWPEVWFGPDRGWIRFEPTPAAAANGVATPSFAAEEAAPTAGAAEATPEPTAAAQEPTTPAASAAEETTSSAPGTTEAASGSETGRGGWVLPVALGVLALVLVGWALLLRHRARARVAGWEAVAALPARAALHGWDEVAAAAAARGRRERVATTLLLGRRRQEAPGIALDTTSPPRAALDALVDGAGARGIPVTDEDREAASRLGAAVSRARYAPGGAPDGGGATGRGAAEASAAHADADRLRGMLRRRRRRG